MVDRMTCSLDYSTGSLDPLCKNQRMWPIFLLSSMMTWIFFEMNILIYLSIKNFRRQQSNLSNDSLNFSRFYRVRMWLNETSFGKTNIGKIFVRTDLKTRLFLFFSFLFRF